MMPAWQTKAFAKCTMTSTMTAQHRPVTRLESSNHLARESGTAPDKPFIVRRRGCSSQDGTGNSRRRISRIRGAKSSGASSGEVYEILVAGESLGEIQINSRGRGEFERNYSAAEIPAALIDADATTNITIGDLLSGPIGDLAHVEWSSEDDASDHDDDDLDEGDDLAEGDDSDEDDHLTDEDEDDRVAEDDDDSTDDHTGSINGDADESSELEIELSLSLPGFPRGKFELQVKGGPEDAVLDISVDGELIGQLATNASGNGELELEFDHENAAVPDVLNEADADTRITIGDVFDGLLAELQSFERRTD